MFKDGIYLIESVYDDEYYMSSYIVIGGVWISDDSLEQDGKVLSPVLWMSGFPCNDYDTTISFMAEF